MTTKDNLFVNLKAYYESQKKNIYDIVPLTIVVDYQKEEVCDRMEQFFNVFKIIDKNINSDYESINQKIQETQLAKEKSVKTPYKISRCCHDNQNLWMLKPTGFNRGIGIHIFQSFEQLREIMSQYYGIGRGAKDKASIFHVHNHHHLAREYMDQNEQALQNFTFVIQKLIEKPMLYLRRKFDVRMWALINSFDGRVYVYRECYVRTSSKQYEGYDPNASSHEQIYMQLTNNAIQKNGQEYGKFEEGNIVSTDTLFDFISSQPEGKGRTKRDLESSFKAQTREIIKDTMKAIRGKIQQQRYTFELLGYDFIIDQDLNTVLIEVNDNPCLEESNQLLRCLLPRMLDDMLAIVMDPIFNFSDAYSYKSNFSLPGSLFTVDQQDDSLDPHQGYKDTENLWD